MIESFKHAKKPDIREDLLYDSIYVNYKTLKTILWCEKSVANLGRRGRAVTDRKWWRVRGWHCAIS